jgi:osmotically-inducible protein OsmY
MPLNQNTKIIQVSIPFLAIALTACEPASLIIGGTALVGTAATRDKGVKGTVSDTWIIAKIKAKYYGHNPDLDARVSANVQSGEVILTGVVADPQMPVDAERLAWEVKGVKSVTNEITVTNDDSPAFGRFLKDSFITSQIKSDLLFSGKIKSLNYSVKTVHGVVYIFGIAQTQEEMDLVTDYASKTGGVERVVNYARLKDEGEPEKTSSDSAKGSEESQQ